MSIDLEKLAGTVKVISVVVVPLAILAAGYEWGYSAAETKAEQQAKAAELESAKALEAKYREKENESAKKVASALAERDKALSNAAALRADAQRVRLQSASLAKQLSRAAGQHTSSGDSSEVKLGRCERLLAESSDLLGESVELAGEGASLSTRVAADKDAVVSTVNH